MVDDKEKRAPGALTRIKEFEANIKALEEDLIAVKKMSAGLEKEKAKLEKYKDLDPENKELKKKITGYEKELQKLEKIKGLQGEHRELRKKHTALEKDFKKLEKNTRSSEEYNELEKKYGTLENDIEKLTMENENLKPKFVGAKTAFNSIQGEKNELKVQIMTLTSRLTEADTEKEELKTQNALLVIENEKIKTNSFRHKHENICKWKEEQALKAQIADLEKTAEQKVSDALEAAELKQGIMERGDTIKMNMDRIAGLEQTIQGRDRAITALQDGQNTMANKEIQRTLQIHRLTEQIAIDQNHNKYLYNKLATEMRAYHANVYHLRMGYNTEVPFPSAGGGYASAPMDQYRRSYDADVDRTGLSYMTQEDREGREVAEFFVRREAEERYRSETDAGLHGHGELGKEVVGSIHLGLSGEQIGHAGVEAYHSQNQEVAGPFGYRGQRGVQADPAGQDGQFSEARNPGLGGGLAAHYNFQSGDQVGNLRSQNGEVPQFATALAYGDQAMYDFTPTNSNPFQQD